MSGPTESSAAGGRGWIVANAVVWIAVLVVAALYWTELRWAADELPLYLDGTFSDPPERVMLLESLELMGEDPDSPEIDRLLHRSLAIDPYGEAAFWLARRAAERGDADEAIAGFEAWLAKDPTDLRAWLALADLQRDTGHADRAVETLRKAERYYDAELERFRPALLPEVGVRYNEKAQQVYETMQADLERVRLELDEAGSFED